MRALMVAAQKTMAPLPPILCPYCYLWCGPSDAGLPRLEHAMVVLWSEDGDTPAGDGIRLSGLRMRNDNVDMASGEIIIKGNHGIPWERCLIWCHHILTRDEILDNKI